VAQEPKSIFPNPWEYLGVPQEDIKDLLQLYKHLFLTDLEVLPRALDRLTYHPNSAIGSAHLEASQGQEATEAAMFFVVCDFVALNYARTHPTFKMKPIPQMVLNYLAPPYNQMTSLDIEDQRRFKASLPPEQQEAVYIDD